MCPRCFPRASCRLPGGPWERSVAQRASVFHRVLDDFHVVLVVHGARVALEDGAEALGGAMCWANATDLEHVDDLGAAAVTMQFEEYGGHASRPRASTHAPPA